jgi:hypothetical protein
MVTSSSLAASLSLTITVFLGSYYDDDPSPFLLKSLNTLWVLPTVYVQTLVLAGAKDYCYNFVP